MYFLLSQIIVNRGDPSTKGQVIIYRRGEGKGFGAKQGEI